MTLVLIAAPGPLGATLVYSEWFVLTVAVPVARVVATMSAPAGPPRAIVLSRLTVTDPPAAWVATVIAAPVEAVARSVSLLQLQRLTAAVGLDVDGRGCPTSAGDAERLSAEHERA